MDPRFIRKAEMEGRQNAVASFRLAVEREKHHRAMFHVPGGVHGLRLAVDHARLPGGRVGPMAGDPHDARR